MTAVATPRRMVRREVPVVRPAVHVLETAEVAHPFRTVPGWAYGPHDTLLRITPQTVTGYRLGTVKPV
ncbi:hypothetical protein ABZ621_01855 [Streptomyces sp. NPDC007863]|uniref:hypothetical protein n=1 Tax=Streptomyces sp. NPDC007863 TaxID=3154894 RepID=UPI0033DCBA0C